MPKPPPNEAEEVRAQIRQREERAERILSAYDKPENRVYGGSLTHWKQRAVAELFEARHGSADDALRAVDLALADAMRATGTAANATPAPRTIAERNPFVCDYLRHTANPSYRNAFGKLLMAGDASIALLRMTDERAAFSAVAEADRRTALHTARVRAGTRCRSCWTRR